MKGPLVCFALVLTAGRLLSQEVEPEKPNADPGRKRADLNGFLRFRPTPTPLTGASGDVYAVAFSPDGKRVANVGGTFDPPAGFVAVLDGETKTERFELRLPQCAFAVAYSPDGKHLAVSARDGFVRLLQADTGKQTFAQRLGSPARVCFAPDGKTIATATEAHRVQIWDVLSGAERATLRGATGRLVGIAFSSDGKRLAAGGDNAPQPVGTTFVWDVGTERVVTKIEVPEARTLALAFSPDNAFLATGGADGQVRQWEIPSGTRKTALQARGPVFALAYSPDGRVLAAGTETGPIVLLDPASGEETGRLTGHPGACRALAFAAEGTRLASGGGSRTVKVWDVPQKKELATLRQDPAPPDPPVPIALAATSDGSLVALATEDGVLLRDGRTGEPRGRLAGHKDAVTCVAFSDDGKTLATGSADKTIKLWDVGTAKELFTLEGHTKWVFAVTFSPDGKTLATGGYDKTVRFWETANGKEMASLDAHRGSVRAVAFSPDGKTLASGGSDRVVKVWDAATHTLRHTLKGHEGAVRAVAFSSDGMTLASASEDGMVRIWDPLTGQERSSLKGHTDEVLCVGFAGPHTVVSGGSDGTIRVWKETGAEVSTLPAHPGGLTGLVVLPGGRGLLSVGQDKSLKLWRPDAAGPVRLFTGHTGVVHSALFSADGRRVVSCGNWPEGDKTVRVWDAATGQEILKVDLTSQATMAVFSSDGKSILASCEDGCAYLFDAATGAEIRKFQGHTAAVMGLALSADGHHVLTGSADKTVRLWEFDSGKEVHRFEGHTEAVRRVAFHPDGKHALTAGRDGVVRLWELGTEKEVRQFPASGNWADCLAVSPDGRCVAVGGTDIKVYEVETGKRVHELEGHRFGVTTVSCSADGKYLLSGGYDGNARLWDQETGIELYCFRGHLEYLWSATFSPDGKGVLTAGGGLGGGGKYQKGTDHALRLWAMPDAQTLAEFALTN